MIPLYHDFRDATVLVFGGGPVGARKARRFAAEAAVVVVSPDFDERFAEADFPDVERIRAAPAAADIEAWVDRFNPALVVAATSERAVNEAVVAAARERGILVNQADRSGQRAVGSVVVPATVEDDPVSVAISTGGTSPALSRHLRQQIEAEIEHAGAMAELTGQLRTELKHTDATVEERRTAVRTVVRSPDVWKALHTGTAKAQKEAERVMAGDYIDTDVGGESQ